MYSVMAIFKSSIVQFCNRQVHREFLITLYTYIYLFIYLFIYLLRIRKFFA